MKWRRLVVGALAAALLWGAGAHAADPPPADPAAVSSPAPEIAAPAPFPLVDVTDQREVLFGLLRALDTELEKSGLVATIEAKLPTITEALDRRQAESDSVLEGAATLDELRELDAAWRAQSTELEPIAADLGKRIGQLDGRLAELVRARERWELTLDAARDTSAPPEVVRNIADSLGELASTHERATRRRSQLLSLQARVGAEEARVSSARDRIERRRGTLVTEIFAQTSPPLWSKEARSRLSMEVGGGMPTSIRVDLPRIAEFASRRADDLLVNAAFALALWWLLRSARRRLERSKETDLPASLHVVRHPLSLTLVLSLLPMGALYPEMPPLLGWLVFLAALPALIIIARDYTEASLRPILYALGFFLLFDLVRDVLAPLSIVARVAFVAEMLLVAGFILWLLRPARLAVLGGGEQLRGLHAGGIAARFVLGACLLASLFEVSGYELLALLLGDGVLRSAYSALFLYAAAQALRGVGAFFLRRRPFRLLHMVVRQRARIETGLGRGLVIAALLVWAWTTLNAFALWRPLLSALQATFAAELAVGELRVSLGDFLTFAVAIWLAFGISRCVRFVLDEEVFSRLSLGRGVPYAVSTIVGYTVLFIGFLFAVAAAGFDFTRFTILAGAFGVGIGFGLQNVVNNFVSGLILLFERPIQVGDTLQLGDVNGEVRHIGIRASTVRTWEGADVVVPNGELISQRVTNWTLADRNRRIELPVGVAYGSDPRKVVELLLRVAGDAENVISYPATQALFLGFGESSLDFTLRVWTGNAERWALTRSELALAVHDALQKAGFEIPFPQRDLHVRSVAEPGPLEPEPLARTRSGQTEPS